MSEAIKPTKGEAYRFREGSSTVYVSVRIGGGWAQEVAACGPTANGSGEQQANADLIVEAFNAHETTGLTPRQLVERVKELEEALRTLHTRLSDCSDIGAHAHEAYDSFYRGFVEDVLSKSLPNTVAETQS